MVNSTCGYDPHRRLKRFGGCGVWVGWMNKEHPWGHPLIPMQPHFIQGIAWCGVCAKDFETRHMGFGVFVRPKTEDDNVPLPKGPGLKELYG